MKYSFSMIDTFRQCPAKFEAVYIRRDPKLPETDAQRRGNTEHTEFEDVFMGRRPMTPLVAPYRRAIDALVLDQREVMAELQLGITRDRRPCSYSAPNVFFRGKFDLCVVPKHASTTDLAYYADWKTGKPGYEEKKVAQLDWGSVCIAANFPTSLRVASRFVYTTHESVWPQTEWHILDAAAMDQAWYGLLEIVADIESAVADKIFPMEPSGLCPYCPSKTCARSGAWTGGR